MTPATRLILRTIEDAAGRAISIKQLAQMAGVSYPTARRATQALFKARLIRSEGNGTYRRYSQTKSDQNERARLTRFNRGSTLGS